ncbi:hypothetical protein G7085_12450 [Tessaracoccus sp. HDW20]|uniref:hypothetical protein n=1 Tax=Tessaracoccus coleopterorum TaxID=2714950 RepID=UPI0018D46231|nr:hypothetical protein [Tessaracoccus coleopterorum]NHB85156.1 hypothetical protein [Tessaracoccus coleopterorum]
MLQKQVEAITPHVQAFDGPVYVTTNDLLDYLPDAQWLPIVVDPGFWTSDMVPLAGPGRRWCSMCPARVDEGQRRRRRRVRAAPGRRPDPLRP